MARRLYGRADEAHRRPGRAIILPNVKLVWGPHEHVAVDDYADCACIQRMPNMTPARWNCRRLLTRLRPGTLFLQEPAIH